MKATIKTILSVLLCTALAVSCLAGCDPAESQPEESHGLPSESTTESTTQASTAPSTTAPTVPTETEIFVPDISPDTIGIYIPAADGTPARKRITEFTAARTAKKDIDCFEILASREDLLKGPSFATIWSNAWCVHEGNESAKIGFHITFTLTSGEVISRQLLKPSDSASFFDYLEIYMYDDIHQSPGMWYTHLEDKDITDTTIISSIKLTSGSHIAQVGDITLTAFIYNGPDCFDANGNYIGLVSETIVIQNSGS